ncbi:MAG: hypothetical protein GC151_17710 [Betaproteobacteria bacterium]|nr:hypothetical protein [Betaproteobacteria bacterium]
MNRLFAFAAYVSVGFLCALGFQPRDAVAAGSVEMQVEHIVNETVQEYNDAMVNGDAQTWARYFTENVERESPISSQEGKQAVTNYFKWEFANFQAKYDVKRMIVSGRTAAIEFVWVATHKPTKTEIRIPMIAIYDMASSGKFDHLTFYYDTAKYGDLLKGGPGVARK